MYEFLKVQKIPANAEDADIIFTLPSFVLRGVGISNPHSYHEYLNKN
jgi:hypothetical protein